MDATASLCAGPVHLVKILKIADGRSWKVQRISQMRKGDDLGLYLSKTSGRICISEIPS